ncbi:hypothetical protein BDZ45DRAFT_722919 [Acephala macrosclerotiorum]|nr:hypothetical protein BDZ45DRAFT_722919 [Acephala macrosclerotiorum]
MNNIRQIRELNKRELENGVSPEASWHTDYRDTAYVYIGGLPFELSEGDIVTIFSQYGEPTYINLVRDKETGKSRGFAFLKYEDQRSTDLAVDNLGGTVVMGRTLRVDHTRYKKKDDEAETGIDLTRDLEQEDDDESRRKRRRTSDSESEEERPMIQEERELAKLTQDHDDEDPMKAYLIQEKKEEVALALAKVKSGKKSEKSHKHRHRHHKSSRLEGGKEDKDSRHSNRRDRDRRRSRSRERSPARDIEPKARHRRRSESVDYRRGDYKSRYRESPRRDD